MKDKLLLEMHLLPGNQGTLVMKNSGKAIWLKKLSDALSFVGNMKQLERAIYSGANQDCRYELRNDLGLEWILACRFEKGLVGLELWFQKFGFNEPLETLFDWQGSVIEFRSAVNRFIGRLPRYSFWK